MGKFLTPFIVLFGVLGGATTAHANDGDIDTTWGGTGVVTLGFGDDDMSVRSAPYATDRVAVIGNVDSTGTHGMHDAAVLMRFNADGSRDTTCNNSGYAGLTSVDPYMASDMAVLADGSTIVVGTIQSAQQQGFIAKFSPTCHLDPTFGVAGVMAYTDRLGVVFSSVGVASDGSIVVGGLTYYAAPDGGDSRFTVMRTLPDGTPDTGFGSVHPGVWVSDGLHEGLVLDLLVDPSGTVTFSGQLVVAAGGIDAAIARLTNTGVIDTTYADSGWYTPAGSDDEEARSLARRPSGGVVAVGVVEASTTPVLQPVLYCLDDNGAVDSSCGTPGRVTSLPAPIGTLDSFFWSVVVDDSGRFVISGIYDDPASSGSGVTPIVVRLRPDGSPDPTFGTAGVVVLPYGPGHAVHVTRDTAGRILVGGHEFTSVGIAGPIVRLQASTTTSTIAPLLLPATGGESPSVWAVVVAGLGLALLLVRRYAVNHPAR
ncbi:MAG: hypothetical protein ACKOCE_08285 [Acidimicrobiia bacterium]